MCSASLTPNQVINRDENKRTWGSGAREAELSQEGQDVVWQDYFFLVCRFAIFAFIICFPFIRGGRVWYQAGGRIIFRRSGDSPEGSIEGLTVIRPDMERWLILSGYNIHRLGTAAQSGSQKLTPEEVYSLPEIPAPKACEVEKYEYDDIELQLQLGKGIAEADELAVVHHGNIVESTVDVDDTESDLAKELTLKDDTVDATADPPVPSDASDAIPEQESPDGGTTTARVLFTTTMSTSCSICIDDFEQGETIRLLPRCGHAFHTDCILPWLTERQGCCPCCKEDVIERLVPENNAEPETEIAVVSRRPRNPHRVYMT